MPAKNIGKTLKELRLKSGLTQKQAYEHIGVAQSTFSSWEVGKAEPPNDVFMKLCDLYNVKNILQTFGYDGYNEDGSLQLNMEEVDIIEKYRLIKKYSPDGKIVVDTVLNREYAIAEKLREQKEQIQKTNAEVVEEIIPRRILAYAYYGKIAAAGTSVEFSGMTEGIKSYPENDININADYVIGVSGDSMEPEYYDGDIVYVKKAEHLNVGEIGIFQKANSIYIKKVGENGLISLNSNYPGLTADDDRIIVLGKVLGKAEE